MSPRPIPALSLVRTSGLLGVASVIARVANFGVIAALGHSGGRAAVGLYGIATLVGSLAALVGSAGLPVYLTRMRASGEASQRDVAGVHGMRLFAIVVIGGVIWT